MSDNLRTPENILSRKYRDWIRALEGRLDWLASKRMRSPNGGYIEAEYAATKKAIELMRIEQAKVGK